jgi:hypothetical protein
MANGRHSYVAFYPSDWLAGTARLPRMHRAAFFDVCCFTWDTARPCPPTELAAMLCDIKGWRGIVEDLVSMGKLVRNDDGSVENPKALAEAEKAYAAWRAMSDAGKGAGRGRPRGANRDPIRGADSPDAMGEHREPEPKLDDANASSAKRGTRLPNDWQPNCDYPANVHNLISQWPPGRADRELDQFRGYWSTLPGAKATKLDWDKTWHNRIRDQHDRIMRENGHGRSGDGHGPSVGAALDWINGR